MNPPTLLTPEDLSKYLSIPVATLYGWRRGGIGPPCIKIGKHLRYPSDGLAKWLGTMRDGSFGQRADRPGPGSVNSAGLGRHRLAHLAKAQHLAPADCLQCADIRAWAEDAIEPSS
jgi:hypothetical protein